MPNKDMLIIQVPGLCIGGGCGRNNEIGFIAFTRGKLAGTELQRFKEYQRRVLFNFINNNRKEVVSSHLVDCGVAVPDELTAVSWFDGDMSQVKAVASEHQLFFDNKVIANKQNAAATAVEQPCDLTPCFKDVNRYSKNTTASGIDRSIHPFKNRIYQALNSAVMSELKLNGTKLKVLVDKLTVLPEIATRATTQSSIMHGFYAGGLLDKKLSKYPVFKSILGTRNTSMPDHLYNKLADIDTFKKLLDITEKNGHISEEVLEELGFPKDANADGTIVTRDATISQESYQRAKRVNHPEQIRQREERIRLIRAEERRIAESKRVLKQNKIDAINNIRDRLLDPDVNPEAEGEMENCTLEMFAKLSSPELIEFIVAHDPMFQTKSSLTKLKIYKGDDDLLMKAAYDALENNTPPSIFNTKVLAAYRCRNNACKFELHPLPTLPPVTVTEECEDSAILDVVVDGRECEGVLPSELLNTNGSWCWTIT